MPPVIPRSRRPSKRFARLRRSADCHIHPPVDDIPGRVIGAKIGSEAFALATSYYEGLGGGGNDIIDGGDGDDIEIQGFVAGANTDDRIDLSGRGYNFEWLMAHATEAGGDVILDLGEQQITLRGVSLSALHTDDFLT